MKSASLALSLAAMTLVLGACHQKTLDGKVVKTQGSYVRTCRNVVEGEGGALSAECLDAQGQFHTSSLQTGVCKGDIANTNGVLTCAH